VRRAVRILAACRGRLPTVAIALAVATVAVLALGDPAPAHAAPTAATNSPLGLGLPDWLQGLTSDNTPNITIDDNAFQWLTALPDFAKTDGSKFQLPDLRALVEATALGLLGLVISLGTLRWMVGGAGAKDDPAQAFGTVWRGGAAGVGIVLWPWAFGQLVDLTNLLTHGLLAVPDRANLAQVVWSSVASTNGLLGAIIFIAFVLLLIALVLMKVAAIAGLALIYVGMPLALVLGAMSDLAWVPRALTRVLVTLIAWPVIWALTFMVFNIMKNEFLTPGTGTSLLDQNLTDPLLVVALFVMCLRVPKQITTMAAFGALLAGGGRGGGGGFRLPSYYSTSRAYQQFSSMRNQQATNTMLRSNSFSPGGSAASTPASGLAASVLSGIAGGPAGAAVKQGAQFAANAATKLGGMVAGAPPQPRPPLPTQWARPVDPVAAANSLSLIKRAQPPGPVGMANALGQLMEQHPEHWGPFMNMVQSGHGVQQAAAIGHSVATQANDPAAAKAFLAVGAGTPSLRTAAVSQAVALEEQRGAQWTADRKQFANVDPATLQQVRQLHGAYSQQALATSAGGHRAQVKARNEAMGALQTLGPEAHILSDPTRWDGFRDPQQAMVYQGVRADQRFQRSHDPKDAASRDAWYRLAATPRNIVKSEYDAKAKLSRNSPTPFGPLSPGPSTPTPPPVTPAPPRQLTP
jgi:hypothetical protein